MICPDCVDAADTNQRRHRTDHPGHDACRTRNADREPGQHADCTCQHDHRAVNAEPEDVTDGR